ncbi:DUF3515 family protein [Streptomyces neyagawaensis]|uniref:DUF3515 family protein n=1 Tax=Streptomyces neyagawaensis TaxID=42238 RepID=UPI0035566891
MLLAAPALRCLGLPVPVVSLIAVAGCSSADDGGSTAVPGTDATVTKLCRNLDGASPRKVDGLGRRDPEPAPPLTAGRGSPAIILRRGVHRPPWTRTRDQGGDPLGDRPLGGAVCVSEGRSACAVPPGSGGPPAPGTRCRSPATSPGTSRSA